MCVSVYMCVYVCIYVCRYVYIHIKLTGEPFNGSKITGGKIVLAARVSLAKKIH